MNATTSGSLSGRRKIGALLAFMLWAASMPIQLFEYRTREQVASFNVYNLYNWIPSIIHEPTRVITEPTTLIAIIVYAIPGFLYIGLCYLICRIVVYIAYGCRPPSAHHLTKSNRNT